MPLHVSSTCAHHQEVKIALHSLWYHHTYRWPSHTQAGLLFFNYHNDARSDKRKILSPYLRIRGVSLSSIHYNQSHRIYIYIYIY